MKRYEYMIHHLLVQTDKSRDEQVLDALNQFGHDGWRLNRMHGEFSLLAIKSWQGALHLLLERELND